MARSIKDDKQATSVIYNTGEANSIAQVEQTDDPAVAGMMQKLSFVCDPELNAAFPQKRLCRAEITLGDGGVLRSAVHEPRGEASEHIDCAWLSDKFRRTTEGIVAPAGQEELLSLMGAPFEK